MRLKNISSLWHRGENYAILNLPFVCYSVQPLSTNIYEHDATRHLFSVSYKSPLLFMENMEDVYPSIEIGMKSCEQHLELFLNHMFRKLEGIIDLDSLNAPPAMMKKELLSA